MSEPVYLWNWYRTRRHIKRPDEDKTLRTIKTPQTLCGQYHHDRAWHEDAIRRLARFGNINVKVRLERLDTVPLCKFCERIQAKALA